MAAYRFGDPRQLERTVTVTKASEVVPTSKISVLSIVMNQRCEYNFLNVQYRIDGEISEFPSKLWYEGRPVNGQVTVLDNELKATVRRTNLKHYGIRGPKSQGSLLIIDDVVHGRARLEECGTSAESRQRRFYHGRVEEAYCRGVSQAIDHRPFSLQGPKGVITLKFVEGSNGDTWLKEISTFDAYQGKQNELAFFDMVADGDIRHGYSPALADEFLRSSARSQRSGRPAFTSPRHPTLRWLDE